MNFNKGDRIEIISQNVQGVEVIAAGQKGIVLRDFNSDLFYDTVTVELDDGRTFRLFPRRLKLIFNDPSELINEDWS